MRHKRLKEKLLQRTNQVLAGTKELENHLSPQWILDCVMYDRKHNSLVISPLHCLEHKVTAIDIAQDRFCTSNILHFRLDYNLKKVKK